MVSLDRPSVDVGSQPPRIRPYSTTDFDWAVGVLAATGGRYRVRRGAVVDTAMLPGFVVDRQDSPAALVTITRPTAEELELTAVAAMPFDDDLLRLLLAGAVQHADALCRRIYSICSNAEFDVQRTLQRNGFRLAAARPGVIDVAAERSSRPLHRQYGGLPMTDELEFELMLVRP